jgi:hypothetical protein
MIVELETDPYYDNMGAPRAVVYCVWSGIRRIPSTHSLRAICVQETVAKLRVEGLLKTEAEYHAPEDVEVWYERLWVDHLFGEDCMLQAREIKRTLRTGD